MEEKDIEKLLESVRSGNTTIEDAVLELKKAPFEDMGFARVDTHRGIRQGTSEVVFGQGKTPEQILKISSKLMESGQKSVLITRMYPEAADFFFANKKAELEFSYDKLSRVGIAGQQIDPEAGVGKIVIATGGTSDIPVAEEAGKTASEAVEAFEYLSRVEGIIPAVESSHALAYALKYVPTLDKDKIVVINLSGRGDKDVASIAKYKGVNIDE